MSKDQENYTEYSYILQEINRLFEEKKDGLDPKKPKKNLELVRIYLPKKDFKLLENLHQFKKLHNLGGIPCFQSKRKSIAILVEIVNPRKRKKKAIVYVREERE